MRKTLIAAAALAFLGSCSFALADDNGQSAPGSLKQEKADPAGNSRTTAPSQNNTSEGRASTTDGAANTMQSK